jgi:hypothetical protein
MILMNPNDFFRLANNFVHAHPLAAFGFLAAAAVIVFLRPKQTISVLLLLLGLLVAGYILYYVGGATVSGISGKEGMIHK